MPTSQICMPWVLYLFYEEVCQTRKAKQAQPQSSQIGVEFSSTVLNASTFLRSKTRKPFMKHSHKIQQSIDLTRPPQITMEKLYLPRGWGEVMSIYLHRALSSCILVTCSYACMWDQWWTEVQITQTFQLPPLLQTAFCYGFHTTTGCHLQWLLFLFRNL